MFVTQGTGITLFLTIARSHDSVKATLLQVGTPHFFDEVAAATGGNAEHRDHRESLQEAVCRTFVNRPVARRLLPGRPDFVVVATQLAEAGVPARSIHRGRFWGMRNTAPRHTAPATTSSAPDRWQAWSGWMSKGLGHPRRCQEPPPKQRSQRTWPRCA